MKVMNYKDVEAEKVDEEGAEDVTIRWLITAKDEAPTFSMRHFEVAPGGYTPLHSHPWEHEVFILHGQGTVVRGGKDVPLREGDLVFIPPGEEHQFKNQTDSPMTMLCLIPNRLK